MAVPLLHITTAVAWSEVVPGGELTPESLTTQGFVHLSTPEQVHLPANRLYAGRTDLVLLCLDPARLEPEVRWEPGVPADPSSMVFPHLYGPLDSDAVIAVQPYRPDEDGTFSPPVDLPKV